MLREAWRWFLYGDTYIFHMICLVMAILFLMLSVVLLRPAWHQYTTARDQWLSLKQKFEYQSSLLKNSPMQSIPEPIPIPWLELAHEYGLVIKSHGKQIYFAGTTDQIIKLLVHVLRNHGKSFHFRIEKNHYKTLLVIANVNGPGR